MDSPTSNVSGFEAFEFRGKAGEYFKIWIVNIFLMLITLGIYSAWAKVRTFKYFYGNTFVGGCNFDYLADPRKILKGRFIAVGLLAGFGAVSALLPTFSSGLILVWILILPALVVMATSFALRNSSFRNLRFSFRRDYAGAYKMFGWPLVLAALLAGITATTTHVGDWPAHANPNREEPSIHDIAVSMFGLFLMPLLPYLDFARMRFLLGNASYGQLSAQLNCGAWSFYKVYLKSLLVMFSIFAGLGFMAAGVAKIVSINRHGDGATTRVLTASLIGFGVLAIYGIMFYAAGYLRARRTNLINNHTRFGDFHLKSDLRARDIGWIYLSNTIAAVFSLGLLLPWARIRMTRYTAAHTALQTAGLETVQAAEGTAGSVIAEEIVDVFDVDLGL